MACGCGKIEYSKAKAKKAKSTKTTKTKIVTQGVKAPKSTKPDVRLSKKISTGTEYGRVMYQT